MSNENLNNQNGTNTNINGNAGNSEHSLGRWEVLDGNGNMVEGNVVGSQDTDGDGKQDAYQVDINGDGRPDGTVYDKNGDVEWYASSAAKDREELSYKKWAARVDEVLHAYSALFSPQRYIVGGGISRKADKWVPFLTVEQEVIPAKLRNQAGIIGAAMAVRDGIKP